MVKRFTLSSVELPIRVGFKYSFGRVRCCPAKPELEGRFVLVAMVLTPALELKAKVMLEHDGPISTCVVGKFSSPSQVRDMDPISLQYELNYEDG